MHENGGLGYNDSNLNKSGGIGNVIPHPSLSSNAYLVLIYRTLCLGLLHPLIPIHLNNTKLNRETQKQFSINDKHEIGSMQLLGFRESETVVLWESSTKMEVALVEGGIALLLR